MLLQGCGGSSSSPSTPTEPVEYTFSLNAQLTNDCGVSTAFTEVELLLQDDTWQTLNSYTADENGLISFVTESEFINYTLIAKDQQDSEVEGLNIVSFYQASSETPAYYQAQFDEDINNSTCDCITQDLEVEHRSFAAQSSVTSSLTFDAWVATNTTTTLFEGVELCRIMDGSWPLHSVSVTGIDSNGKAIASAGFIDGNTGDFSANDDELWQTYASEVADEVELNDSHQELSTNQVIGDIKHFSALIAEDVDSILVFDTHSYISEAFYQAQASVTFDDVSYSSLFGSVAINTYHQVISTDAQESLAVEASEQQPDFNYPIFDEINADGSYDYSAAASDYPMAIIAFTFTAYDPDTRLLMPAKWTFYGPESGTLAFSAPLTGYEDIIDFDTDIKTTKVELINSDISNDYDDYIKYYQGNNVLDITDVFVRDIEKSELILEF